MSTTVEQRGVGNDLLHQVVREGLPVFLRQLEEADRSLPAFVLREFERFLVCGDPDEGFAWLYCEACDHHRLVPFSCKGRGFCPSCGGRRMADRAAHWIDHVLPRVGVRQWVLTVPWGRRFLLARDHELLRGVLAIAVREIFAWYRADQERRQLPGRQTGSIAVVQRFGSALRLNVHFHILVLDGCYDDSVTFRRAHKPRTADIEAVVARIASEAEAWLAAQGHGPDDEACIDEDDAQELLQAAAMVGRAALGKRAGRRTRRVVVVGGREVKLPPRCAVSDGYNLHAGVAVGPRDREGLERLCRYLCRPALAKSRLERRPDGLVVLHMKRVWSDGTAAKVFSPAELVARLAALIPPPRKNEVFFHGVLAPHAKLRSRVVPEPPRESEAQPLAKKGTRAKRPRRWRTWSELLWRVFGFDGWKCPHCAKPMTLRAVVIHPPASTRVLGGLSRSARGPPTPPPAAPRA